MSRLFGYILVDIEVQSTVRNIDLWMLKYIFYLHPRIFISNVWMGIIGWGLVDFKIL